MMELKIFKGFERYVGSYPEDAVSYALKNRKEAVEELLYILDYTIKNAYTLCKDPNYMIHFTAMFLLAYFRETRAYDMIVKIGRIESQLPDSLLEDQLYTGYKRVLASVFDGRLEPIKSLIEDINVDESVRVEALLSLLILMNKGKIAREEIVFYIKELLNSRLEEDYSAIWDDIPDICLILHPGNLIEDIRSAVNSGKIMSCFVDIAELRKQASRPVKEVLYELKNDPELTLIDKDDLFLLQVECEEFICEFDEELDYFYDDEDNFDIIDDGGNTFDFIENKDWDGLLEFAARKLQLYPKSTGYLKAKAAAYENKGMYQEAIEILVKLHNECPDSMEISCSLLDNIFKLGKDEDYVSWILKPDIMKSSEEAADFCYEFMKRKRKPRPIIELYNLIREEKYPKFDVRQMIEFLRQDGRFLLQDVEGELPFISVIKKK